MLPVQNAVASAMRWTALRIPPIRRLYDDRGQLACALAEAKRTVGELQEAHRASEAQLNAIHAEQAARLNELTAQLSRATLDRPLAFMHVPKASGVALKSGIREVLPSTPVVSFFDIINFRSSLKLDTMSPETRATIDVNCLPPSTGADFVCGHLAYSTLVSGRPDARFMTVLREPYSRLLSLWMFWRSLTDEALGALGASVARVTTVARKPLVEFLASPEIAPHTDNVVVRLLLWPHPLIPDDDFIPETADQRLAEEAIARLQNFDFADVFENPQLERNVRSFLARPFVYRRVNETQAPPPDLGVEIDAELSDAALRLLDHHSRLDRQLWLALIAKQMPQADPEKLAQDALAATVARFRALQSG